MSTKRVKLSDVKEAEYNYALTHQYSTNPNIDLAVSRAWQKWQDVKIAWEAQKAKGK